MIMPRCTGQKVNANQQHQLCVPEAEVAAGCVPAQWQHQLPLVAPQHTPHISRIFLPIPGHTLTPFTETRAPTANIRSHARR
jgi:hypothetical protein